MKVKALGLGFVLVSLLGCANHDSDSEPTPASPPPSQRPAPPPEKRFRITGVGKVNFPNSALALVLEYETDIPIEDKESLRKEVDEIWEKFQNDVEKAHLKSGVILHPITKAQGFCERARGTDSFSKKAMTANGNCWMTKKGKK